MDYKTVLSCLSEIIDCGPYAEDVCELLFDEFNHSRDLSSQESMKLIDALSKWQRGNKECRLKQIQLIEGVLIKKQGYRLELARYIRHRLSGGLRNDF